MMIPHLVGLLFCAAKQIAWGTCAGMNANTGSRVCLATPASQVMVPGACHSDGGSARHVTGTPLFVAQSLLEGNSNVHTESSHMESLYYSIWHSAAGSLPDEWAFKNYSTMKMWAAARLGTMLGLDPLLGVREDVKPFLRELHQLFWQRHAAHSYGYRTDVTVLEFVAVCTKHGALPPLGA